MTMEGIASLNPRDVFTSVPLNYYTLLYAKNYKKVFSLSKQSRNVIIREGDKTITLELTPTTQNQIDRRFQQAILFAALTYKNSAGVGYTPHKEPYLSLFNLSDGVKNANFTGLFDGRLTFLQQLKAYHLIANCATDVTKGIAKAYTARAFVEPARTGGICSFVAEDSIFAISCHDTTPGAGAPPETRPIINTHLFFDATHHALPFIFGANVDVKATVFEQPAGRALLEAFYAGFAMGPHARKTFWIRIDTAPAVDGHGISIVDAGMSAFPSAAALALKYTTTSSGKRVTSDADADPDQHTFTLEHVPPGFRGLRNVASLFKGKTMIHNEYARYCDPHANVNFDSPVDSVIHKSIQLLGLVNTILPNLSKEPARFSRSMAAAAQRLHSDEDQLLGIMTLMRSLQVDGEFERYFKVPRRRKRNPEQYTTAIADNQEYVENWDTEDLPTSSIVPAPRII